jgi:hypothetical protein
MTSRSKDAGHFPEECPDITVTPGRFHIHNDIAGFVFGRQILRMTFFETQAADLVVTVAETDHVL